MVEPKWLEQAYIIYSGFNLASSSIIDESVAKDAEVDIKAVQYRKFVQEHPE
jgi:hypothetical protein